MSDDVKLAKCVHSNTIVGYFTVENTSKYIIFYKYGDTYEVDTLSEETFNKLYIII